MNILLVLVPVSLALIGLAIWAFFWAVDDGQFDDLDTPGFHALDDDKAPEREDPQA
ncbi:MAG TPA: cbb3-type cytochrome oxidase assembly protein CcoS [Patescibacteria group bacterium]|nr:cbb3-type cytochrome oxidase assembly protein CcoS [Patescibacteria group bacterium]